MGDPDGEPLILIMGLAAQMLAWEEELLRDARRARLPRRPLRQPRHRPLDDPRRGRDAVAAATCSPAAARRAAYLLADMADDTFGLMDQLGIESAHVVGASMGGMIGQTMAIRSPSGSARWSR